MLMDIKTTSVIWILILSPKLILCRSGQTAKDIGYTCKHDSECKAGNGGEYSKCNQDLNICICTINHLGEDKCLYDSHKYDGVCRQKKLYTEPGYCTLECSPIGTIKSRRSRDWYGDILEPFSLFIHDKKTSACYDPLRAFNSVPDGFEIKTSTIADAGLGVFTNIYIERGTVIGPYKGIFEPDFAEAEKSGYSWKIFTREHEDRSDDIWIDAKDVAQSNWLRYFDTPISTEMENMVVVQYKGEKFYLAFKSIQPGTELLIWYGSDYEEYLGIEPYDKPAYQYAKSGYAGGFCDVENEGQPCPHDENTICAEELCFCIPGTHIRAGMCMVDEALGGICAGSDGDTCEQDLNAKCERGVCVCKSGSSPANGVCAPDETFGGRCKGRNGQTCLLDDNAECVHGLCKCKYGSTGFGRKCQQDEAYDGRCVGDDGEECELDQNAECWEGICECKENASAIDGICEPDGTLHGMCMNGKCFTRNAACDSTSYTCVCKATYFPHGGKCVQK